MGTGGPLFGPRCSSERPSEHTPTTRINFQVYVFRTTTLKINLVKVEQTLCPNGYYSYFNY